MCWGFVCVKASIEERGQEVGGQSSGLNPKFRGVYLTAHQPVASQKGVVRVCNGLLPRWRSSIPLMHWAAFTTLFSAALSSWAALKPQSDVDTLCGVLIEFQKQFQDIWLRGHTVLVGTWLPVLSLSLFFSWKLGIFSCRWSHWGPGCCSHAAQPDTQPCVSMLKSLHSQGQQWFYICL